LLAIIFLVLLGITTAECALVIGALLVFALLIAPAATAEHLAHRPLHAILLSVGLGLAFTWGGLVLSFAITGTPFTVSFYIAALAASSYLLSLIPARRQARRKEQQVEPHSKCKHVEQGSGTQPAHSIP
jgi:zinc/manganese transport system permease protein